jgi:hypothetical protein
MVLPPLCRRVTPKAVLQIGVFACHRSLASAAIDNP